MGFIMSFIWFGGFFGTLRILGPSELIGRRSVAILFLLAIPLLYVFMHISATPPLCRSPCCSSSGFSAWGCWGCSLARWSPRASAPPPQPRLSVSYTARLAIRITRSACNVENASKRPSGGQRPVQGQPSSKSKALPKQNPPSNSLWQPITSLDCHNC